MTDIKIYCKPFSLQIGDFTLQALNDNATWIERGDGEGMGVDNSELLVALESFYNQKF